MHESTSQEQSELDKVVMGSRLASGEMEDLAWPCGAKETCRED